LVGTRYPNDVHDRLWFSWKESSWTSLSTSSHLDGFEFEVPSLMLQTAAVPSTGSSINIAWSTTNESTCLVVLHFSEIQHLPNNSLREFYLYANGELIFEVPIPLGDYLSTHYAYYTQSDYTDFNLSLESSARATHPPILNGFEVYTILPVTFLPTYDGDGLSLILCSFLSSRTGIFISLLINTSNGFLSICETNEYLPFFF
jgi:Malectin-like domain